MKEGEFEGGEGGGNLPVVALGLAAGCHSRVDFWDRQRGRLAFGSWSLVVDCTDRLSTLLLRSLGIGFSSHCDMLYESGL